MSSIIHPVFKRAAVVALSAMLLLGSVMPVHAATQAELEAQIQALMAQIASLGGGSTTTGAAFTMDMTIGASGAEVTRLQNWLISKGYSIPAGATGYFGAQTAAAVAAFQKANGITPAVGYVGPTTRAKINALIVVSPTPTPTPKPPKGDDVLTGGAGSIESYELMSSLNNEKVGENEEDVEVAGLKVTADDGSDIRLTAVRLDFAKGTATRDFKRFASEVSVYLDGEEVARVDGDEFTKKNNWSKTVSLDKSAIIKRGDAAELTIAVSGVRNLDSADLGKTWTVDVSSVRFTDAQGASITENPNTDTRSFSFVSFATAADVELRIANDDEDINNEHVIQVDASKRTNDAEILSFTMEARGDSDITIDSLPITFAVTGAEHLDDMASSATLYMKGDEIGSENVRVDADTVVFEDLGLTLKAGKKYNFVVAVDLLPVSGALDEGDTISATLGETETNSADFDAEDESGENLRDADITGSATGGEHVVYETGMQVEFVSAEAKNIFTAKDAGQGDRGSYTITFKVTAFDEDIRIDRSCAEDGVDAAGQGVEYTVTNTDETSTVCNLTSSSSDSEDTANTFEVDANKTRTFKLNVVATAEESGFVGVNLASINWGTATDDTNAHFYTFNLGKYRTDPVFLNFIPTP